jgi:hypothetical protein
MSDENDTGSAASDTTCVCILRHMYLWTLTTTVGTHSLHSRLHSAIRWSIIHTDWLIVFSLLHTHSLVRLPQSHYASQLYCLNYTGSHTDTQLTSATLTVLTNPLIPTDSHYDSFHSAHYTCRSITQSQIHSLLCTLYLSLPYAVSNTLLVFYAHWLDSAWLVHLYSLPNSPSGPDENTACEVCSIVTSRTTSSSPRHLIGPLAAAQQKTVSYRRAISNVAWRHPLGYRVTTVAQCLEQIRHNIISYHFSFN